MGTTYEVVRLKTPLAMCPSCFDTSLPLLLSGRIKEHWCHQRPVTTRVNGASHMCSPIDTHRYERQAQQLETEVFGDLGQGIKAIEECYCKG